MNQFAKISPSVTLLGEILKQDDNGKFTIKSGVYLKRNECGICADDFSIICMYDNGNKLVPVKLIGGNFKTTEDVLDYIKTNTDKSKDGEIISPKDNPTTLYVVTGNELYNVTENIMKSIKIKFIAGDNSSCIYHAIETSDIREPNDYVNGKYRIHRIIIKSGEKYYSSTNNVEFTPALEIYNNDEDMNNYHLLPIYGNRKINEYIIDDEFEGILCARLARMTDDENLEMGYFSIGSDIQVTIMYTPIKN